MLCVLVGKETRPQEQGVLPVLRFNSIDTPKQPLHPIDLERLTKKIELSALDLLKASEHHTG
jgi:hypothetical protein